MFRPAIIIEIVLAIMTKIGPYIGSNLAMLPKMPRYMRRMLIWGTNLTCVKFSGCFDEIIKIPECWELLHYGKCATEHVFIETLQVKELLSYHGN